MVKLITCELEKKMWSRDIMLVTVYVHSKYDKTVQ